MKNEMIFVNLPVKDLKAATAFYEALGYTRNPQFSNDSGSCIVVSQTIHVMLLVEEFFKTFTKKPISDAKKATEVLLCLSCESRDHVDELVAKAQQAGGTSPNPKQDHAFMYGHGFEDLDGHVWELMWMDPAATPPQA
jgi:uncharacterized protein